MAQRVNKINCPWCGSVDTVAKYCRVQGTGRYRSNLCRECNESFPTFQKEGEKERVKITRPGSFVKIKECDFEDIASGKSMYRVAKENKVSWNMVSNQFKKWKNKK